MALDPCPYCGREFDHSNAGAREQHVQSCERDRAARPTGDDHDRRPTSGGGGGGGGAGRDARQPRPARQSRGGRGGGTEAGAGAGDAIAGAIIGLVDDDVPSDTRRDAIVQGASVVGETVAKLKEYHTARQEQREARAQNADLEPVDDYPSCECGYTFDEGELADDRVRCPDCSTLWEVAVVDTGEVDA